MIESSLLTLGLVSLAASLAAMPIARSFGQFAGLLDEPQARKLQSQAVPRTGGIGILIGLLTGFATLMMGAGAIGFPIGPEFVAILVGGIVIHLTGVLDDLLDLPAVGKLLAQMLAVGVVVSQGVVIERLTGPGGFGIELGLFAGPFTAFVLLGFVNAVNLVDGLDGLAAGVVAIGAAMLMICGVIGGNLPLAALATILFASILGFLPWNFSKNQKIFLGDAGSMMLGYMLPVVAIAGARFSGDSTPVLIVLAAAVMPVFDTLTTILRRFRNRVGIFSPDSMHVHHRLIRFGLSPRRAVLVIHAATLAASGLSLAILVDGTKGLLVASTLAAGLVVLEVREQRRRNLAEEETTFREIAFYLLGAQNGRGPRLGGELAMVDVIADLAARAEATAAGSPARAKPGSIEELPVEAPVGLASGE